MHADTRISGPALQLRIALQLTQLTGLLLALSGCGDVQIPLDERTLEPAGASARETPSERPSSSSSQSVNDEAIDIALWGGPLFSPLQKWRPQRADGESAPDDAE